MGQASLCEPADVFTRAPPVRGKDVVDTVFGVELGKPFLSNVAVRDAVCVGHEVANGHGPDQGRMHACGIIPEGVQHLNIREFRKVKGHRVIESQLTAFPEDHGCRGCGGLGHRTDAEQAVLVHGLPAVWVLDAKSLVAHNLSFSCEKEHGARNVSLVDLGFNGRGQTRPGSVLRQVEGDGLGVQSHLLLSATLAGVERNSNGKEAEDSKWMHHGAQFREAGRSHQVESSYLITPSF